MFTQTTWHNRCTTGPYQTGCVKGALEKQHIKTVEDVYFYLKKKINVSLLRRAIGLLGKVSAWYVWNLEGGWWGCKRIYYRNYTGVCV